MPVIYFKPKDLPTVGTVIGRAYLGQEQQRFEMLSVEPYVAMKNRKTYLLTWRSRCLDCELPFHFTSGMSTKRFKRRCPSCLEVWKAENIEDGAYVGAEDIYWPAMEDYIVFDPASLF